MNTLPTNKKSVTNIGLAMGESSCLAHWDEIENQTQLFQTAIQPKVSTLPKDFVYCFGKK